ncbi:MAG TPA: protein translocase subunit SecD [Burkholderiales bacterium]|nr:protein translocase subunit SecD [Burkholderiales bacterium]
MNRYSLWVYITIAVALVLGLLYTAPNFYGESPAVQISSARTTLKVDSRTLSMIEEKLKAAGIEHTGSQLDPTGIKLRFADTDTQLKARDLLQATLNPEADPSEHSYTIAPNLLSASPGWLSAINARPMYLGLDLRGGVHFLLQVDMQAAVSKRIDALPQDIRSTLRENKIRHGGVARESDRLVLRFRDADTRNAARDVLAKRFPELNLVDSGSGEELRLNASLKEEALTTIRDAAIKQNINTLSNRVNALGVSEPVIQQQGLDRIVVQLPGVQDTARAKSILGRTATLEVRLVNEEATRSNDTSMADFFPEKRDDLVIPVGVYKEVVLTGEHFVDAGTNLDPQTQSPIVQVTLDSFGGQIMRTVTRENLKKRMAIILFEKGKGEAISVATIQGEFGNNFQISGDFSTEEANDLSLLIKAGSLAAPMEIIEERLVGPSLGKDNIEKGFQSTMWGFIAIIVFMIVYYAVFGAFSSLALAANLLFLIALLSLFQATLTLPGIAAIALTLGMAIDANVLINERIREELRSGKTPQAAIATGYERAFGTILDSNITTLIAGVALWIFGSGPVRGFATVHCLGILTSIFSAVVVSRGLVNLYYGSRRKLSGLAIGNTSWK